MLGPVENVRSTTRGVQKHVVHERPLSILSAIEDATFDGGPRKRQCHSAEWFWTGVIITLAAVALVLLVVKWPT